MPIGAEECQNRQPRWTACHITLQIVKIQANILDSVQRIKVGFSDIDPTNETDFESPIE